MLGNYIGFSTAGNYTSAFANGHCFPGCEANDNGQGVNIIDGSNRTIVDGNWIDGLRSGVAVNVAGVARATSSATTSSASPPTAAPASSTATGSCSPGRQRATVVTNNKIANTGWAGIGLDQSSRRTTT